jgi:lipopolysaccharide transport system permease protein
MALSLKRSAGLNLVAPVSCVYNRRPLLLGLIRRDIEIRFRGTVLGRFWAVLAPLVMLAVYTFVFGTLIQPRWQAEVRNPLEIPLIYFSGLILFDFIFECLMRAPNLMRDHQAFIKKIVFPVEILAWVVMGAAGFRFLVSSTLLLAFFILVVGVPPASALAIPIVILPLGFVCLAAVWLLSALGAYVRDVSLLIAIVGPIVMFLTPIFYPLSVVPDALQPFFYINPMTYAIEATRAALFKQSWPAWWAVAIYYVAAWLTAVVCYRVFIRLRPGFADVL